MPPAAHELGIDISGLAPPSDLRVLQLGGLDREVRRARRSVIKGDIPQSVSRETIFATLSAFLINTAGIHARLWREGATPDTFMVAGLNSTEETVSIFDPDIEAEYHGDHWKALSSLLKGTFFWSLKEEQKRLIRLGHNGQINPASRLLAHLDRLDLGPTTPIGIIAQVSDEMEEAVRTSALTISALYKMVGAYVKAHDVPDTSFPATSAEIASHNYHLIDGLLKAHPAINTFVAGKFEEILEGPSDDYLDLFQLEEGPEQTVRMSLSPLFVEAILQSVTRDDLGKRRICPASEVFVDTALVPPEWRAGRDLSPLVRDMNDLAFETAVLVYQRS